MPEIKPKRNLVTQNKLEFAIFQVFLFWVWLIPKRVIPFTGRSVGLLLFYLRVRRRVVEKNLEIAFGNSLSDGERRKICRNTYKNVGNTLLEFLLLYFIKPEELDKYITIEGLDTIHEAIAQDRGLVFAANHLGNWELFSAGLSVLGAPFHLYVGKQRNGLFDHSLNEIRQKFNVSTISKSKTAGIEMIKVLKKGGILAMAGDLNVPADKLFVDFFGMKASVGRGIPSFTVSQSARLFFVWTIRVSPLKHRGFVKEIRYESSGKADQDYHQVAQLLSNELEEKVRQHPDQYFWFNRRWKTRPQDEDESTPY